jgi:hypothetical protein
MWNVFFFYIYPCLFSFVASHMVEIKHPVEIAIRLVVSTCASYYSELVRASKFCGEERSWFNKVLKRVEFAMSMHMYHSRGGHRGDGRVTGSRDLPPAQYTRLVTLAPWRVGKPCTLG